MNKLNDLLYSLGYISASTLNLKQIDFGVRLCVVLICICIYDDCNRYGRGSLGANFSAGADENERVGARAFVCINETVDRI